jgi:hypothetical protein
VTGLKQLAHTPRYEFAEYESRSSAPNPSAAHDLLGNAVNVVGVRGGQLKLKIAGARDGEAFNNLRNLLEFVHQTVELALVHLGEHKDPQGAAYPCSGDAGGYRRQLGSVNESSQVRQDRSSSEVQFVRDVLRGCPWFPIKHPQDAASRSVQDACHADSFAQNGNNLD